MDGYFEWLLNRAGVGSGEYSYTYLCNILHDFTFYPQIEMDENRWEDGLRYREEYSTETGMDAKALNDILGGCTVLELILSLAEKMHYETLDSIHEAGTEVWFEELISNLGLDMYTNRELMENENAYFEVEKILHRFLSRRYSRNGEGGLFPLRHPVCDQRHVELAIQMNDYIAENYDVLG